MAEVIFELHPTCDSDAFNLDRSASCLSYKDLTPLPNNKILDWFKLKAFADDKINVTEKLKFVVGMVENVVGKGENAGYHNVFKRLLIQVVKSQDCVVKT